MERNLEGMTLRLPSEYLSDGLLRLDCQQLIRKTRTWRVQANTIFKTSTPAKPSLVMAAFTYLRLSPDFEIRRGQDQVCAAFGVSAASLRRAIRIIAPQVIKNGWKGGKT